MRTVLLAFALWLTLSATAAAQAPVCRGQNAPPPPISEEQRELEQLKSWAASRAEFGFRHDLEYVRKLYEQGTWEYDVSYFPATDRENEYLKLRDRLTLGAKGDRYVREHREVYGGLSVEDGWPRDPYLRVRFTRDVQHHLAALKQVAAMPKHLRAKRVRFSERALRRVQSRVDDDWKALDKAGFHLQSTSSDTDRGVVKVELVTKRKDTKAYFAKRYDSRVKPIVRGTEETVLGCHTSTSFSIAPDGLSITVTYESGGGAQFEKTEVVQNPDRVVVGVVERSSTGPRTADLVIKTAKVPLSAPLGDRAVIDAGSTQRLIQAGPSPGDPPCVEPPEPTELQQAVEDRAREGFNADPAYTQQLLDQGRRVTAAEQRWLDRKDRLEDSDPRVDKYVNQHADAFGSYTIEGKFPAAPYIVYGTTKDHALHDRALKRLTRFKGQLQTRPVQFTFAQLAALERQIRADAQVGSGFLDGYGRAGFFLQDIRVEGQSALVRVWTTRPDAATWLTARYGPAVSVEVVGERFECATRAFDPI
ncbi:hypothetical protein OJ997_24305 [Solirubrobacter phytolaccae]|uniref:ADP ribosyltransferase domain-containing protein n=1 Tax=Solirubrobacter phytolaccae TaxID=1404360 RepID=A0A9X3S9J0_9ACTN|nr:hypothetical protein [Solirubrobacter phytolaccae]MDA0183454.1 hypothetical protein [Solirubrobacter phytolaccae]